MFRQCDQRKYRTSGFPGCGLYFQRGSDAFGSDSGYFFEKPTCNLRMKEADRDRKEGISGMTGAERRKKIVETIQSSTVPVSGGTLSALCAVSRQLHNRFLRLSRLAELHRPADSSLLPRAVHGIHTLHLGAVKHLLNGFLHLRLCCFRVNQEGILSLQSLCCTSRYRTH